MKNFAFLGVGGYIAPRHIQAISDTGNRTVLAYDPNDSVGILDRYTQDVAFYTEFERFKSHWDELRNTDKKIDWLSICSPNYLHSSQLKFGLSQGVDVICEKPLVLTSGEINVLKEYENQFSQKINTILQLRVHDSIVKLKEKVESEKRNEKYDIDLTYLTSRGPWYHESWKGDVKKSGGLTTNIGVHFFDMLTWLFGDIEKNEVHVKNDFISSGYMELEKARVKWVLSVDRKYLPESAVKAGMTTYRSITIDNEEIEFSGGFTDLHTKVYKRTLSGNGFGLDDTASAIKIVEDIRNSNEIGLMSNSHSLLRKL
jgi:UDP-N-acetyl-2-amino-2-deoxyglucuronate dehydrogenase